MSSSRPPTSPREASSRRGPRDGHHYRPATARQHHFPPLITSTHEISRRARGPVPKSSLPFDLSLNSFLPPLPPGFFRAQGLRTLRLVYLVAFSVDGPCLAFKLKAPGVGMARPYWARRYCSARISGLSSLPLLALARLSLIFLGPPVGSSLHRCAALPDAALFKLDCFSNPSSISFARSSARSRGRDHAGHGQLATAAARPSPHRRPLYPGAWSSARCQ